MQAEKCFTTKHVSTETKRAVIVAAVLLGSISTFGQAAPSQLVCRTLDKGFGGNSFISEGETVFGNSACHVEPIKAAVTAPSTAPATPPAPVAAQPVAATPAAPVSAPAPTPAPAAIVAANPSSPKPQPRADGRKRLFITDEPIDEANFISRGSGGGKQDAASGSGTAVGFAQRGANPRTVELDALVYKTCGSVAVTSDVSKADYVLLFRRDDGRRTNMFAIGGLYGLLLSANSKINGAALFSTATGDLAFATEARTVQAAIKDTCRHIE